MFFKIFTCRLKGPLSLKYKYITVYSGTSLNLAISCLPYKKIFSQLNFSALRDVVQITKIYRREIRKLFVSLSYL